MYYNYFRDYDPATGRYVQSDPIGLGGGVSTFGYGLGNPILNKDPLGLFVVHGNWCGPNWTGGRSHTYRPSPFSYYAPSVGYVDASCERHDICYASCRDQYKCKKDDRGRCMTQCDRELAEGVRFGYNSGTSVGKATAIYLWMRFNTFPDPGDNDPSCKDCEPKK